MFGMSTVRETTNRSCLPQSPMNTILRENEKNVISAGSAGSASRDNNIEQTTNTDTEYN